MFWGVTLETGKRYSQVVDRSYHLSMAALEPLPQDSSSSTNKFVSVMIEHNKSEFVLCTLEQNNVLQVNLDLCFVEGEEVTYFITGEGTVHLTGYVITDGDDEANDSDESEENEVGFSNTSLARLSRQSINQEDDSEDCEDQDWRPGMKKKNNPVVSSKSFLKAKDKIVSKNQEPKIKIEKQKKSSPEQAIARIGTKGPVKTQPTAESSDDDEDEDFLMGNDHDEEEDDDDDDDEDDDDSGEDSQENDEDNSEWEDADEEEDNIASPLVKKAKLDTEVKKKHPFGTPNSDKSKTPQLVSSDMKNHNEKGSHKKSLKQNQISPTNKLPGQKEKTGTPKSSSGISPQDASKPRKSFGGIEVQDLTMGNGPIAKSGKMVHVYYRGTLANNKEFDSCLKGKAFSFRLGKNEVIKGWDVGIQGMKVGGKRKLIIPPAMGYGNKPSGPIPPNSTLHFDVELKAVS